MSDRINDVKKRIAKRRKERSAFGEGSSESRIYPLPKDEERYGEMPFVDYEHSVNGPQPIFRKEVVMFQVLLAVSMFLVVGILFKDNSPRWESARAFVNQSMDKEFQFATVLNWYEDQFGQPVALLPNVDNSGQTGDIQQSQYVNSDEPNTKPVFAVPVAGRVLEPFNKDGQGIMVETGRDSLVEVINDGVVIEIGVKDEIGKTVVVQHPDGSETWYGNLDEIDVKLYDFVKSRTKLGKVVNSEDGQTGTYYFAIKQNDHFVDPIQVINFE
ncbi:M23 family metallopeptidase [Bacillus sp. Marseille-P3661]|uniref:M23 family metallopeptidase n=1 Tax=Bacillus sp. Marseille-P3661 TaxID=1936234 RepID=UPI000C85C9E8|nr:M23 family metallopeptidase [Bacillus sp. Marseille-P3661]